MLTRVQGDEYVDVSSDGEVKVLECLCDAASPMMMMTAITMMKKPIKMMGPRVLGASVLSPPGDTGRGGARK